MLAALLRLKGGSVSARYRSNGENLCSPLADLNCEQMSDRKKRHRTTATDNAGYSDTPFRRNVNRSWPQNSQVFFRCGSSPASGDSRCHSPSCPSRPGRSQERTCEDRASLRASCAMQTASAANQAAIRSGARRNDSPSPRASDRRPTPRGSCRSSAGAGGPGEPGPHVCSRRIRGLAGLATGDRAGAPLMSGTPALGHNDLPIWQMPVPPRPLHSP